MNTQYRTVCGVVMAVVAGLACAPHSRAAELSGDLVVTGKVGVGVFSPAYRLDVGGDINLTGTLLKNGAPLSLGSAGGVSYGFRCVRGFWFSLFYPSPF